MHGVAVKVVIAAIGSRGDVVPFAHVAHRFAAAGHDVTVVTHETLTGLLAPGLDVVGVPSNPEVLLAGPAADALRSGNLRALNRTRHVFADFIASARRPAREALGGADVLVASTLAIGAVDEALGQRIPVVRAQMWPEFDEFDGPMPLLPYAWLVPTPLRRAARRALRRMEPYLGGVDGVWRRGRLYLMPHQPVGLITSTLGSLYAFSPRVVPDSPARGAVTGWWTAPGPPPALSPEVETALRSGEDWIFVGFGSMHQSDPDRFLTRLGDACAAQGVRAVAQFGARRGMTHPHVLCIGEEPHAALFTRVRAVIHHGGAGTTGSAVRAGVPSVVVPHFADQFYWGHRLHALGVAPRPLPRPLATTGALARAIGGALRPSRAERAASLADAVRGEDGAGQAVAHVERWMASRAGG